MSFLVYEYENKDSDRFTNLLKIAYLENSEIETMGILIPSLEFFASKTIESYHNFSDFQGLPLVGSQPCFLTHSATLSPLSTKHAMADL